tara:strand:+ start:255 stop:497 length:243 start_codon:yes stop_codon:yes gene_type:complete
MRKSLEQMNAPELFSVLERRQRQMQEACEEMGKAVQSRNSFSISGATELVKFRSEKLDEVMILIEEICVEHKNICKTLNG